MYYIVDDEEGDSVLLTIIGHLCQDGKMCGLIKKFGLRLRVPLCEDSFPNELSSVEFIDPITLENVGPSFRRLIGRSILYSWDSKNLGRRTAYIYNNTDFAIIGNYFFI